MVRRCRLRNCDLIIMQRSITGGFLKQYILPLLENESNYTISLNTDNTLTIIAGKLSVNSTTVLSNLIANAPLTISSNTISLNHDSSLKIVSGNLSVDTSIISPLLTFQYPIFTTGSIVQLDYDTNQFQVTSGALQLKSLSNQTIPFYNSSTLTYDTALTYKNNILGSINLFAPGITTNAINIPIGEITIGAGSLTITAGTATIAGLTTIGAGADITGLCAITGSCTISLDLNVTGLQINTGLMTLNGGLEVGIGDVGIAAGDFHVLLGGVFVAAGSINVGAGNISVLLGSITVGGVGEIKVTGIGNITASAGNVIGAGLISTQTIGSSKLGSVYYGSLICDGGGIFKGNLIVEDQTEASDPHYTFAANLVDTYGAIFSGGGVMAMKCFYSRSTTVASPPSGSYDSTGTPPKGALVLAYGGAYINQNLLVGTYVSIAQNVNIGDYLLVGSNQVAIRNTGGTTAQAALSIPNGGVYIYKNLIVEQELNIGTYVTISSSQNAIASSPPAGALIVSNGGAYVKLDLIVGGAFTSSILAASSTLDADAVNAGSIHTSGGIKAGLNIYGNSLESATTLVVHSGTDSTSKSTGALIITGGLGVGNTIWANFLNITSIADATNTFSGCAIFDGGIAVGQTVYTHLLIADSSTDSTSTSTGALIVKNGGLGVAQTIYCNALRVQSNTDSTDIYTAPTVFSGGIAVSKTINANSIVVGQCSANYFNATDYISIGTSGTLYCNSLTDSTALGAGSVQILGGIYVGKSIFAQSLNTVNNVVVGGTLGAAATTVSTLNATSTSTLADATLSGNCTLGVGSTFKSNNTTDSTSRSSGSVQLLGGLGVQNSIWTNTLNTISNASIGGTLGAGATTLSTLTTTGLATLGSASVTANSTFGTASTIYSNNTTDSTSLGAGAFQMLGGLYVAKSIYCNSLSVTTGVSYLSGNYTSSTDSTTTSTGALIVTGGLGIGKTIWCNSFNSVASAVIGTSLSVTTSLIVGTYINVSGGIASFSGTDSTTTSSGSVVLTGGLGVGKTIYANMVNVINNVVIGTTLVVNGLTTLVNLACSSTTDSTAPSTGSITTLGGLGVGKTIYAKNLQITDGTVSSSPSTGAAVIFGGLGVANINTAGLTTGSLSVTTAGTTTFSATVESTATNVGSVVTSGGLGVAKTIYSNNLNVASTSTLTGRISAPGGIEATSGTSSITSAFVTYFYTIPNNSRGFVTIKAYITTPAMVMGFFERADGVTFPSINILAQSGSSFSATGAGGTVELHLQVNTSNQIGAYTTSSAASTVAYSITLL